MDYNEAYKAIETKLNDWGKPLVRRVDELELRLGAPDAGSRHRKDVGGIEGYETPGNRLIKQKESLEMFQKTGRMRFSMGAMHPVFEEKTLVDSASLGGTTVGVLGSQNTTDGIVPLPRRRLTVRDLLRSKQITEHAVHFIKEVSFANSASPQVEASAKAESAIQLGVSSAPVITIAHWLPLSRQAVDDLQELRRWVDETLTFGLKLKEESELLSGDGLGAHLTGLTTVATAYSGAYATGSDTKLDKLRHYILELSMAEENPSGMVLNPRDVHDIDLLKTEEGGAGKGSYIIGDPLGGSLRVKTFWGLPVVATQAMPVGKALVGDFSKAIIADRQDATIDWSQEHDDYFIKNLVACRCESRLALAILRAGAFRYGSL